jgi:c-di-GMP-binding flagellar brake protein YcgR
VEKSGSGRDNRQFKRLRVNLSVVYRVDRPAKVRMTVGNKEIRSTMLDLSEGGISLLTNCNIPEGTLLLMKFTLFNLEQDDVSFYGPMEILGEVRYVMELGGSEFRLGIRFKRIEGQDKGEIADFVQRVPQA